MNKKIGLWSIAIITVATVANIRNISSAVVFGDALLFYYGLSCLLFFIPSSLVVADFSYKCDSENGIYDWVELAMGKKAAILAVWLQWVENVFYYPLSLLFIISSLAQIFNFDLSNLAFCIVTSLVFWLLTFINIKGIDFISKWIGFLTVIGLILPIGFLFIASILNVDNILNLTYSIPQINYIGFREGFLIALASFLGVEINNVHMKQAKNAVKCFVYGLLLGSFLVIVFMVFGSWCVLKWVEGYNIHAGNALAMALTNASVFLGLKSQVLSFMIFASVIAPLGGVSAWIIGPVVSLSKCCQDLSLKLSQDDLLIYQAILVTFLSFLYLFFDVAELFNLMTFAMVGLYLLMYIMMFVSGLMLCNKKGLFSAYLIIILNFLGLLSSVFGFLLCILDLNTNFKLILSWLCIVLFCIIIPLIFLNKIKLKK